MDITFETGNERRYSLLNYVEIITYWQLPFYVRLFRKEPTKKLIQINGKIK